MTPSAKARVLKNLSFSLFSQDEGTTPAFVKPEHIL